MTTMTAPKSFDYSYGDTVTNLTLPLPNKHRYTDSQQKMVDIAINKDWELDTTAIRNTYGYGIDRLEDEDRRRQYLSQHPFVFVRPADDGTGTWQIELDYVSREYSNYGNRSFNKALLGAKITFINPDGTGRVYDDALSGYADYNRGKAVLQKQSTAGWASTNWITRVLTEAGASTLRAQVELLLEDPALVLWLAAEAMYEATEAESAARRERERQEALKARPLPEGWSELKSAARAVANADGISDTAALLVALKAAVAAVEGAVVR
jgi:hypothetical protein